MSIVYDPKKMLEKAAPDAKIKRLVSSRLTLKKAALSFVTGLDFLKKKDVSRVAVETLQGYRKRVRKAERGEKGEVREEILDDPKQLIQRVQNAVVLQVSQEIKKTYPGRTYTWLPSDADEPDPEHQLNYGKTFVIGEGEMPGERIGCRCGMEIHGDETELELG